MVQSTPIETDLIIAQPLATSNGYTWTLASRLGAMLRDAQQRFGERDASYTLLGFEFCGDVPKLWYPGNCRHVVIQLTQSCLTDLILACYQLAHECVHLLSPSGGSHANIFEEGLATQFAHRYVQDTFHFDMPATLPSYQAARLLVERLLALDADGAKADLKRMLRMIVA